jgi:hypothetical protein
MMQRMPSALGGPPSLGSFQSVAVLMLCAAPTDVYVMEMHYTKQHSIDIARILLHTKFEVGLSISIWRNKAALTKK